MHTQILLKITGHATNGNKTCNELMKHFNTSMIFLLEYIFCIVKSVLIILKRIEMKMV
ncbi:hypothetical protein HanRHA438_Chr06g0252971 [Helianthus annuus]|nr:hypothetical protein HanRHA438_Chr06g0252971 [Helianthus annuus]